MDLLQEYSLEKKLFWKLREPFGTPLIIDTATQKHTFGHYAQMMVDIDIIRRLFYEAMVERESFAFLVEVD
jgi:hypothetical protein